MVDVVEMGLLGGMRKQGKQESGAACCCWWRWERIKQKLENEGGKMLRWKDWWWWKEGALEGLGGAARASCVGVDGIWTEGCGGAFRW